MNKQNYFKLLLLAIITFSFSSCVIVDNPDEDIVYNTTEVLCNKNWVETYYGTDAKGPYYCEHTIRFNFDGTANNSGTGYERFVYREVDAYKNIGKVYQDDNGQVDPMYRFHWTTVSSGNLSFLSVILDNPGWTIPKKFKDMEVRRNTLTGILDATNVIFYNKSY